MNFSELENIYSHCELCPRRCRVDRRTQTGFCGSGTRIRAAKAMLHPWEEPAITADGKPSGTVFFSNCTLGCRFCQNYKISQEGAGKELTPGQLAEVFLSLQEKGASNIDLVTPTHYLPGILEALDLCKPKLKIPVVYNCGGYERKEIIELLEDYVDYWLPDLKYYSADVSARYSLAPDYFETAMPALEEMLRQVRKAQETEEKQEKKKAQETEEKQEKKKAQETEEDREKKKEQEKEQNSTEISRKPGKQMVVRHMVLPGQKEDSIRLLRELAGRLGTKGYLLSLMSQYTPFYKAGEYPEINRRLTTYEYEKVLDEAVRLGFDGFMQERTSAKEEYTPVFDFEGL